MQVGHQQEHGINDLANHNPVPGDHDENAIVVMDANGLPVKDSGIPLSTIVNGLTPKGEWDASGGTYPVPGKIGDFWWISVAGVIGGVDYQVKDWLVFIQFATPPPESAPAIWKKIDNTDQATYANACQFYWVSTLKGSDTIGDGSLFNPFATAQAAINAGVLAGQTSIDIICDQTTVFQNITAPTNKDLSIEAVSGPEGSPHFQTVTLSPGCQCSMNSVVVDTIVEDGSAGERTIWFEEGYIENAFTLSNTHVRLSGTRMAKLSADNSTALTLTGHVYSTPICNHIFFEGIDMNNSNIRRVADIEGIVGSPCGIKSTNSDIILQVGDNLGAKKVIIKDSLGVEVATIDSDGNITLSGTVDGVDISAHVSNMIAHNKPDVTLAGVAPVDADVSAWTAGDRGHGIGTGGREFYMVKRGTAVKFVELS